VRSFQALSLEETNGNEKFPTLFFKNKGGEWTRAMIKDEIEQKNYLLWVISAVLVVALYTAIGFGFVLFYVPSTAAIGAPEMIMIDFAPEPQAPEVEEISEDIQEETVIEEEEQPVEDPEPEPVVEEEPLPPLLPPVVEEPPLPVEEPEPEIETPPSDMVEEKPLEKQEEKMEEPEKIEPVKSPEPEKKKPQPKPKAKQKPKEDVKKAPQAQKSRGPQIVAPKAQKFAAPSTNRQYGDMGKAIAGWRSKVQRRVAYAATRVRAKSGRGRVATVKFSYNAKGVITAVQITRSSGDGAVDAIALQAVNKASPIPAPPNGQAGSLSVPVKVN